MRPGSRSDLLPPELGDHQAATNVGGASDGVEIDTPLMASTSRQPPAPGEQQRVHQDDHQRNLPMPPTTGHERYDGVLVENHNGNNDGNGVKVTDRAGAASTLFVNDSDGCHAGSTSAADDTTTAAPGARARGFRVFRSRTFLDVVAASDAALRHNRPYDGPMIVMMRNCRS